MYTKVLGLKLEEQQTLITSWVRVAFITPHVINMLLGVGMGGGGAVKAFFATVRRGPQCKANTNVASVGFPARDGQW